jgi:hypothetical protein
MVTPLIVTTAVEDEMIQLGALWAETAQEPELTFTNCPPPTLLLPHDCAWAIEISPGARRETRAEKRKKNDPGRMRERIATSQAFSRTLFVATACLPAVGVMDAVGS